MSDDLQKRSRRIAERFRELAWALHITTEREDLDEAASALEDQAAEITRLRAELATARIELEHAARQIDCQCGKRDLVLNELRELGSLHAENVCPRDRSCLAILAATMRAAAKKNRERPLTHLDANDTRTFIINESGDLVGLQDKSEKDREP